MNKYEVFTANYSKLIMADSEEEARQKFKAFIPDVDIVRIELYKWIYDKPNEA